MRKMGPLAPHHPLVHDATKCPACHRAFAAGDFVTLVSLGPGESEEARLRRDEGRPYNAVALPLHWECSEQRE